MGLMRQQRKIQQQNLPKWKEILLLKWREISLLKWGAISLLIAIVLFCIFPAYIRLRKDSAEVHKKPTEENKREFDVSLANVQAITSIVGTIATIIGGIVLYKNYKVAEAKQITERFSKAIDQLGNKEQLQVRLGGIYSLERIAKDSPKDLWTIVEVLSSFIREYAAARSKGKVHSSLIEAALQNQTSATNQRIKLPTDIQAAFTVIDRIYKQRTRYQRIDLQGIDLSSADLRFANLSFADLSSANLSNADLSNANLSSANLNGADLNHADLNSADINSANLSSADLRFANLSFADLRDAFLISADLSNASLRFASLSGAMLNGATVSNANLSNANLNGATVKGTNLNGADLSHADLSHADLSHADLSHADLSHTDLSHTDLSHASLSHASLNGAIVLDTNLSTAEDLTKEQLEQQSLPYLCKVKLPPAIEINFKRNCKQLPQILMARNPERFETIEDAQKYIDEF